MASLETTRGRQVPAWQQANRYYQEPTDYVNVRQSESTNANTAPATRKRRSTNGSYKIQKGDTLSAIAKRYGTTVQAIAEANGIKDVNKIYAGDSLTIPGNTLARTQQPRSEAMQRSKGRIDTAIAVSKAPKTLSVNRTQTTPQEDNRIYKQQRQLSKANVTTETTNTSTQKPNNTVSLQTSSSVSDIDNEIDYIRHKLHAATTDKERNQYMTQLGYLYKRKDIYNAARRIDLAQQVGRVPKQLSTTSTINNGFSKSDMAAIRQDQNRRPAVVYNTRSKPSLRRNQRYSRTGDTRAIRYNKNRPRTWNDYKNQKAGWISELYG